MTKYIVLLLVLSTLSYVIGTTHYMHMFKRKNYYCGDRLTKTLMSLCDGIYNSPSTPTKKSLNNVLDGADFDAFFLPNENDVDPMQDYYSPKKEALESILMDPQSKRSITEECCKRPCSLDTLRSYCG